MKKNLICVLMLVAIFFASCKKENNNESKFQGTIQFGLSQTEQQLRLKSSETNQTPSAIIITIADSKGTVIVESKKVGIINLNNCYLSDPLSLTTGNYSITKFIVLNNSDSVIYATPIKVSKLAYLVNTPLPIAFSISKDNVTKVTPEVISVRNAKFEDFGYDSFSFDIVKTFDFLATIMVYNESVKNWELTSANITIKAADNSIAYNGALASITNQITLRDNSTNFSITVCKDGYQTYVAKLTAEELKLFFKSEDKGPLIIKLLSESTTVTDIDGNIYHSVKIGNQVWMVENLKVTKNNDGSAIPNVTDNSAWAALATPGYCWYNNDLSNKNPYGALYNWHAVNTGKLAPVGWHIPTENEWRILTNYLGTESVAGSKMKEVGTTHWSSPNSGATNETGFTALPGGYRFYDGSKFNYLELDGFYWSSTENPYNSAGSYYLNLYYDNTYAGYAGSLKNMGLSIRCVKD